MKVQSLFSKIANALALAPEGDIIFMFQCCLLYKHFLTDIPEQFSVSDSAHEMGKHEGPMEDRLPNTLRAPPLTVNGGRHCH